MLCFFPRCFNFAINALFLQIYLAGFAANIKDKLNRILNVGGATRFDDISDAVTHVIVGDENKASTKLKTMKLRGLWYVCVITNKILSVCSLIREKILIFNFS